jgi:hypothetical protein
MSTKGKTFLAAAAIVISSAFGGWIAQQSGHASAAVQIPAGYVGINPGRIYDSRGPSFTNARLSAGQQVTINSGQPGASAVGVNIVMTDTVGAGFLTAWPSGPRPNTSVINSTNPGENVANFLLIPVAPNGTFQIFTLNPTHIVIDIMGFMAGGSAVAPTGFNGQVTGYQPLGVGTTYAYTMVTGDVSNGTSASVDLRADVHCPDGTVSTASVYSIPAGATHGWGPVMCDGSAFSSGASVTFIEV